MNNLPSRAGIIVTALWTYNGVKENNVHYYKAQENNEIIPIQ